MSGRQSDFCVQWCAFLCGQYDIKRPIRKMKIQILQNFVLNDFFYKTGSVLKCLIEYLKWLCINTVNEFLFSDSYATIKIYIMHKFEVKPKFRVGNLNRVNTSLTTLT